MRGAVVAAHPLRREVQQRFRQKRLQSGLLRDLMIRQQRTQDAHHLRKHGAKLIRGKSGFPCTAAQMCDGYQCEEIRKFPIPRIKPPSQNQRCSGGMI